jgi:predicted aspartyl protease
MVLSYLQFKIDTGADLTTISKKDLMLLGYSHKWIEKNKVEEPARTLTSAGGKTQTACYIKMDTINILGRELIHWPLYIRKENEYDFPNLLGINVLSHFNLFFNFRDWVFKIENIIIPKKVLPVLPGQHINNMVSQ